MILQVVCVKHVVLMTMCLAMCANAVVAMTQLATFVKAVVLTTQLVINSKNNTPPS